MKNSTEEKNVKGLWSWVVLFSAFATNILMSFPLVQFSLIYQDLIVNSQSATVMVAWIFNLFNVSYNAVSLFTGPLGQKYGHRIVAVIGGFFVSVSLMTSVFVNEIEQLFFNYSLLSGSGAALMVAMTQFIVPLHFERNRGFAVGVLNSGFSVGQFVGPFLINSLRQNFRRYSVLILGAITFNLCCLSMTFTSPKAKNNDKSYSSSDTETTTESEAELFVKKKEDTVTEKDGAYLQFKEENATQCKNSTNLCNNNDFALTNSFKLKTANDKQRISCVSQFFTEIHELLKSAYSDLKLLRLHRLKIYAFGMAAVFTSQYNYLMLAPIAMNHYGYSDEFIGWNFSIMAAFNLASRILVPAVSDWIHISKRWYIIGGSLQQGITIIAFTIFNTPKMALICSASFGISMGSTTGMFSLLAIEFMGIELMPAAYGTTSFLTSFVFLSYGPLIGWIRDITNSYSIALNSISVLCFISTFLWCIIPFAVALDNKNKKEEKEKNIIAKV